MPTNVYKVLGQHNSTANLIADVYTVPASNSAVLSSITVCNQTAKTHHIQLQLHQMVKLRMINTLS